MPSTPYDLLYISLKPTLEYKGILGSDAIDTLKPTLYTLKTYFDTLKPTLYTLKTYFRVQADTRKRCHRHRFFLKKKQEYPQNALHAEYKRILGSDGIDIESITQNLGPFSSHLPGRSPGNCFHFFKKKDFKN
jgi:hypothetical protein